VLDIVRLAVGVRGQGASANETEVVSFRMANEEAKLFVAGLPDSISEEVLKQLFEATGGKVVGVSLPKDRTTGRLRGFGFVTLATPQEAQAARDALDGSMQAGKSISVRPFQAEPPETRGAAGPRRSRGPGPGIPGSRPGGPLRRRPTARSTSATCPYDATPKKCRR
jgi:nucleolin